MRNRYGHFARIAISLVGLCLGAGLTLAGAQGQNTDGAKPTTPAPPNPAVQEMTRLNEEGERAYRKADYPTAQKAWQTGLEKAQALQDEAGTALFLRRLGGLYSRQGQFDRPLDHLNRALAFYTKQGEELNIADCLNELGSLFFFHNLLDKAADYYGRALARFEKLGKELNVARVRLNLGNVYTNLGQFDTARDYLTSALPLLEKQKEERNLASAFNTLGTIDIRLGQLREAVDYLSRALNLCEKQGNPQAIAAALNNLGAACERLAQFDRAIDCFTRSLSLRESLNNKMDIAGSLINLGSVYDDLGQFDTALAYYRRALTLFNEVGDQRGIAMIGTNQGNTYHNLNRFAEARDCFMHVQALWEKVGTPQEIADNLSSLSSVYESLGQYDQALELRVRVLTMRKKLGNPQDIAESCINLSSTCIFRQQYDDALRYAARGLTLSEQAGSRYQMALSHINLGIACSHLHRLEEALRHYSRALADFESVSFQVGELGKRGQFQQAQCSDLYAGNAELLLTLRRPWESLALLEQGRSRELAEFARRSRAPLETYLLPADAARLRQLTESYTLARSLRQTAREQGIPGEASARERYLKRWQEIEARYQEAELSLTRFRDSLFVQPRYAAYRRVQGAAPITPAQLRALSLQRPNTLYLEYAALGAEFNTTLLFALRQGRLQGLRLPLTDKVLSAQVRAWLDLIAAKDARREKRLATTLYADLLAPLERAGLLLGVKQLVVVGDGATLDVPFAALRDRSGRRLVERMALSSAFSLGSLTWPVEARRPARPLLCVADPLGAGDTPLETTLRGGFRPLPQARLEGQEIGALFPGARLLLGQQATREAVLPEIARCGLLHFATHAIADSRNGLQSCLALAGTGTSGALLEAREVVGMRLAAHLATLSACATAQGQQAGGEGLLGLAWAFRAAGVPAIIASQWAVEDAATQRLMVALYKELKAGKSKDEALRHAMLRQMRDTPLPFYWAAFQVVGDTRPVSESVPARGAAVSRPASDSRHKNAGLDGQ